MQTSVITTGTQVPPPVPTLSTGAPTPPAAVEQPGRSSTAATPATAAKALTVFLVLFPFMIFPFVAVCCAAQGRVLRCAEYVKQRINKDVPPLTGLVVSDPMNGVHLPGDDAAGSVCSRAWAR